MPSPVINAIRQAADAQLAEEEMRTHHDAHFRRLDAVIGRGQRSGVFRRDLPRRWLVTMCYATMHTAADDCAAGRLRDRDAPRVIASTLLAAFTPPGAAVPSVDDLTG